MGVTTNSWSQAPSIWPEPWSLHISFGLTFGSSESHLVSVLNNTIVLPGSKTVLHLLPCIWWGIQVRWFHPLCSDSHTSFQWNGTRLTTCCGWTMGLVSLDDKGLQLSDERSGFQIYTSRAIWFSLHIYTSVWLSTLLDDEHNKPAPGASEVRIKQSRS